jgi:chromosome segregation ATPase
MSGENTKLTFIERVMNLLTGGDKGKVERFHKTAIKAWEKEIKMNRDKISKLDDDIEDKKETLADLEERMEFTLLNVDPEKIKSVEETKAYVREYTIAIRDVEVDMEKVNDTITNLKSQQDECNTQIKRYESLIARLK